MTGALTIYRSAARRNVVVGGVSPSRVEGRVKGPSEPVQKQPHPEGHIGTVTSREFQHDIWVTCEHIVQVRERPALECSAKRSRHGGSTQTFDREPADRASCH